MGCKKYELRTALSKVKGLGSAGNGTGIWWMQKITALALIPLSIWFVMLVLDMINGSGAGVLKLVKSPFNTIMLLGFIGVSLYHGMLGIREIMEDYIHCEALKITSIVIMQFITFVTGVTGIIAVLVFHFSVFNVN
jgi:succinate dehydrogenase membrane anchor subunit